MTCITIDDEPLALELLEVYINKVDFLELKGAFSDPFEASDFLQKNKIDLIFLDIQMPDITGIQWLKTISSPTLQKGERKPMVIFTTAYSKYALDGFELDALDYLLKPFEFERFQKAVTKANDYYNLVQNAENQPIESNFLIVKADYKDVHIAHDEILYVESMEDYCRVFIKNKKTITTRLTMTKMMELLPPHLFRRVHRSYIVALQKIEKSSKHSLIINNVTIPIGKAFGG